VLPDILPKRQEFALSASKTSHFDAGDCWYQSRPRKVYLTATHFSARHRTSWPTTPVKDADAIRELLEKGELLSSIPQ